MASRAMTAEKSKRSDLSRTFDQGYLNETESLKMRMTSTFASKMPSYVNQTGPGEYDVPSTIGRLQTPSN